MNAMNGHQSMQVYLSKPPEVQGVDLDARTVYVSGLDKDVEEDFITQAFERCGEIEEIRLKKASNGQSCFCYIQFSSIHAVSKALEITDKPFKVDKIKQKELIRMDQNSRKGLNTIHISNLSYSTTEKNIESMLQNQFKVDKADITKVIIIYDSHQNKSKGYGYIECTNEHCMNEILATYGSKEKVMLDGRAITMRDAAKRYNEKERMDKDDKRRTQKSQRFERKRE
jgi:RNA recognition motif-containing protein